MAERAEKKKRDGRAWVKPAAIVFFVVMLILTFFSNTIMNYSLAQVDSQQVSSGRITSRIRGTGTVMASGLYDVALSETRDIAEVLISAGDRVNPGDILFLLEDAESAELKEARESLESLELQYQQTLLSASSIDYTEEKANIARLEQALADAKKERAAFGTTGMTVSDATEALRLANKAVGELTAKKMALEAELEGMEEDSDTEDITEQVSQVSGELSAAESKVREAQSAFENVTNITAAESTVSSAAEALDEARRLLTKQMEEAGKQEAIDDLNINAQAKEIEKQRTKVAELEEKTVATELRAEHGGMVTVVNAKAGSPTQPDTILAQIAVDREGYVAEIMLTKEQAKDIRIGNTADVTYTSTIGADVTATVGSIRDDIAGIGGDMGVGGDMGGGGGGASGAAGKVVVFNLEGDVTIGETLNFILSQSSKEYEIIVPSNAVRTDSNGEFVLVITEKGTPLGTRYVATRVSVSVIESDDINSAISGGIMPYDSIITYSSKVVEPGDYVRLAEKG